MQVRPPLARAGSLALVAALAACYSDPVDSSFPAEVEIRLEVGGGFAGVAYTFVVDGREGVVRGEVCSRFCNFRPGDVITPISAFQIAELARALELAGLFGLDGTDFGTGCCDDFHYVLEYHDGVRSATVSGTGFRLPAALHDAISRIHALHTPVMPAIVALHTRPADWPADPIGIDSVRIDGFILDLFVSYSGGCTQHSVDLVGWNGWLESFPVQLGIHLAHDARGDNCRALVQTRRTFDLTPIRLAFEQAYGHGPGIIRLRLPHNGSQDLFVTFAF